MIATPRTRKKRRRGFTLLEVMVAITIVAVVVAFVYQILQNAVRGQNMVRDGLRAPKIQNAILGQIFSDFRYLYWDGFTGDTGFIGRNRDISGKEADNIDFVTARPSRVARSEGASDRDAVPSPLTEVGYALRPNPDNGDWLELWRREDWFIDDDPVKGGKYSLIYDKITRFSLLYYPTPEDNVDGKGVDEWDTRLKKKLPYAIILEISFVVDEPSDDDADTQDEFIMRIITLKGAYNVARTTPGAQPAQPQPGPR
ncbi:MAG: prepilin-type N-terminal cleavage/methylation domain-containing protein [Planctomycetota bacterium]|jgi:prepilin-type N-terminal cleavage/methylation domain-containing protein